LTGSGLHGLTVTWIRREGGGRLPVCWKVVTLGGALSTEVVVSDTLHSIEQALLVTARPALSWHQAPPLWV